MTAQAVESHRRDATPRGRAAVRLKPVEYVQLYGPPERRCSGCHHKKPDEHLAGGRLDREVLEDVADHASWGRDGRGWGDGTYPSVPQIARRIGYSERSVQYSLRRLERSGYVERMERSGFTALYRIVRVVEPVDEWADVVSFPVRNRRQSRRRNTGKPTFLHPPGATVAPELGTEQELTPLTPRCGELIHNDAADAAGDAPPGAARWRPGESRGDPSRLEAAPRRAHRSDAGRARAANPTRITLDGLVDAALGGVAALAPVAEGDSDAVERAARVLTRKRWCPKCNAQPEQRCRRPDGTEREANHAERRAPRPVAGPRNPRPSYGATPAYDDGPAF